MGYPILPRCLPLLVTAQNSVQILSADVYFDYPSSLLLLRLLTGRVGTAELAEDWMDF
jgi:hypothetical protein